MQFLEFESNDNSYYEPLTPQHIGITFKKHKEINFSGTNKFFEMLNWK